MPPMPFPPPVDQGAVSARRPPRLRRRLRQLGKDDVTDDLGLPPAVIVGQDLRGHEMAVLPHMMMTMM